MDRTRRNFKWGWVGLLCLASVMMFGCGGGGGDDAGAPQPAPTVPDVVNIRISEFWNYPGWSGADLLNAQVSIEGQTFNVELLDIMAPGIDGTYRRSNKALTLSPGFFVYRTSAYPTYTQIQVNIADAVSLVSGNYPTAGRLQVTITAIAPLPQYRYFELTFSASGVVIRSFVQPGDPPSETVSLTWQQFDDLENTAPANQWFAKFSYGIWNFLLEQVGIAFDALEKINQNESNLADRTETLLGPSLPWDIGQRSRLVINSSGSGIGPGFDFDLTYTNWWINDPLDTIDDLYNGVLRLPGYIENESGPIGGNFIFNNFVMQETENDQAPTADNVTVNGGFSLTVDW